MPHNCVVVLGIRQPCKDDNAVLRNFTRQLLKDFIKEQYYTGNENFVMLTIVVQRADS